MEKESGQNRREFLKEIARHAVTPALGDLSVESPSPHRHLSTPAKRVSHAAEGYRQMIAQSANPTECAAGVAETLFRMARQHREHPSSPFAKELHMTVSQVFGEGVAVAMANATEADTPSVLQKVRDSAAELFTPMTDEEAERRAQTLMGEITPQALMQFIERQWWLADGDPKKWKEVTEELRHLVQARVTARMDPVEALETLDQFIENATICLQVFEDPACIAELRKKYALAATAV